MLYCDLRLAGERRQAAIKELAQARSIRALPEVQSSLHRAATDAVIKYENMTRPENLLPYVERLLTDATRWRTLRDEYIKMGPNSPLQYALAQGGEILDAFMDDVIEQLPGSE